MPYSWSDIRRGGVAASGFVSSVGHRAGVCPCKDSGSRWVLSWCNPGRGTRSITLHHIQKGYVFWPGSSKGWAERWGSRETSRCLGSFIAKPLPWFISNWEKGPSVAQPVEDAVSLWEEGI